MSSLGKHWKVKDTSKMRHVGEKNPMFEKHHSIETLRKMSEAKMGDKSFNFGKHFSIETRRKIGEAKMGENNPNYGKHFSGEDNPHWKGGISNKREFDFIPLNKYFLGSNAHHIDRTYVIYMPREVHRSIYHSVLRNRNMSEINALAMNYLNNEGIIVSEGFSFQCYDIRTSKEICEVWNR